VTLGLSDLDARRVTAGSHIPGTERSSAVTNGHAGAEICIQEEHGGYGRIWSDTLARRFGTVRHHLSEPGPVLCGSVGHVA
jgi:hypothetical protein